MPSLAGAFPALSIPSLQETLLIFKANQTQPLHFSERVFRKGQTPAGTALRRGTMVSLGQRIGPEVHDPSPAQQSLPGEEELQQTTQQEKRTSLLAPHTQSQEHLCRRSQSAGSLMSASRQQVREPRFQAGRTSAAKGTTCFGVMWASRNCSTKRSKTTSCK